MLGHNVLAVSEFHTRVAKMPRKYPVSDCYLELWSEHSFAGVMCFLKPTKLCLTQKKNTELFVSSAVKGN